MDEATLAVLAVERAWTQAHLAHDLATIERLMADDYAKIQPDGSVIGKAEALASYEPENRFWELAEGDEYDVRLYGDTAVVIGRWRARGENGGVRFDYAARFLSIYVRRNGQWQMVAEQSTDIR
jgi:ketosteroid isomerase-like protein